ncbi:hypothetical protein K492DRAFT_175377 [Lichtheimia hyalospora FSU 10163]|nr:hypothetical protein K492DRAFT_175377 [Lichtheimia hyalospora FSU 10163]
MLDLSSLDQPSNQSWADMMDEELDTVGSDEDNPTLPPSSDHTPSHANETNESSASAVESKPEQDESPKEEKEKQADSSGVVWRIPDAKQRQEQKSVLQMLIERRKNLDKLKEEQQQDQGHESYKREQRQRRRDGEEQQQQSAGRSQSVDSWRRPIGKYERIPVRPLEENKISQWASYSKTLQKEFKEEQEEAKREFIRRFGSKAANDSMDGSNSSNGSNSPKPAISTTPIDIKISADGPSDWADDIPSDDEWPVHHDEDNDDIEPDRTTTKDGNELVNEMQKIQLEENNVIRQSTPADDEVPTTSTVPIENIGSPAPEHICDEEKETNQKQSLEQVSRGWQAFAENEAVPIENKKKEEEQHPPVSNDIDQQQQQPIEKSMSPTKATVQELPGQLKWTAFAHEESRKKIVKAPIIHASPSVSSGTSASYGSKDLPQTPDDNIRARSPSCSTSTANSDVRSPSASSPSPPPPRSTSPLKKKTPLPVRSARSQIMGHLFKNDKKARPLTTTENTVAQQLQQPPMVEFKEHQTHVERVHSSTLETSSVTSDRETASVAISNRGHSATDHPTSSSQQKPINIDNNRAANGWQLFAREHDRTAQMHRSPRSYR